MLDDENSLYFNSLLGGPLGGLHLGQRWPSVCMAPSSNLGRPSDGDQEGQELASPYKTSVQSLTLSRVIMTAKHVT